MTENTLFELPSAALEQLKLDTEALNASWEHAANYQNAMSEQVARRDAARQKLHLLVESRNKIDVDLSLAIATGTPDRDALEKDAKNIRNQILPIQQEFDHADGLITALKERLFSVEDDLIAAHEDLAKTKIEFSVEVINAYEVAILKAFGTIAPLLAIAHSLAAVGIGEIWIRHLREDVRIPKPTTWREYVWKGQFIATPEGGFVDLDALSRQDSSANAVRELLIPSHQLAKTVGRAVDQIVARRLEAAAKVMRETLSAEDTKSPRSWSDDDEISSPGKSTEPTRAAGPVSREEFTRNVQKSFGIARHDAAE